MIELIDKKIKIHFFLKKLLTKYSNYVTIYIENGKITEIMKRRNYFMSRLLIKIKKFMGKVETKENIPRVGNLNFSNNEKYNNIEKSSIIRYGFGRREKQQTLQEIEKMQKIENEKNRQKMVDEIMKLKEQINPKTGRKYTYRDLAVKYNCSRTAIGDIVNGKSLGRSVARRITKV